MNKYKRIKKIINHPQFNKLTETSNLMRLGEGDLKHIGDAMAEGKEILHSINGVMQLAHLTFTEPAEYYAIKKPTVNIGGKELVAPETEVPEEGSVIYVLAAAADFAIKLRWNDLDYDHYALKTGRVFLTRVDAEAMYKAQRDQRLGK